MSESALAAAFLLVAALHASVGQAGASDYIEVNGTGGNCIGGNEDDLTRMLETENRRL